ncbi:unnamed protein product [Moneuplotes crassus]|uniref:Uncharacterized protein n=1 Tax=Euplotes crassus TaxID=5936 RepID=A0AAD1XLU7_EUPCR|nr:unnamed protein product [Moneuplotes crassus]
MKVGPKVSDLEVSTMRLQDKENIHDSVDNMIVVKLPCRHKEFEEVLSKIIVDQMDNYSLPKCPICSKEISEDTIISNDILCTSDFERYVRLKKYLAALKDPDCQVCPKAECKSKAYVGDMSTLEIKNGYYKPRIVQCEEGHNFCAICNYNHPVEISCHEAKPCTRFYDEPLTLRCSNCKLIIQDWLIHGPYNLNCFSCASKIHTPDMIMISPLGYLLLYLLLPVLYPYIILKFFVCKNDRNPLCGFKRVRPGAKESQEWSLECLLVVTIGLIFCMILMFIIFWVAMPIIPIAYCALVFNYCKQQTVAEKLRKDFYS